MAKNEKEHDDRPGILGSFIGGLVCTLILVVIIPVICDIVIRPQVEDIVGDNSLMWLSSSMLVTIIMLICMLIFSLCLGGGAVLRRFGLIGVFALIVAYWLIGNPRGAIIPVVILLVMYLWGLRKGKKKN